MISLQSDAQAASDDELVARLAHIEYQQPAPPALPDPEQTQRIPSIQAVLDAFFD